MPEPPTVDLNIPHNAEERAKVTGYDRKNADSYGHKLVGFTFNPSGDPKVAQLKGLFAEIIDICHDGLMEAKDNELATLWNEASLRSLDAQMWTVKAATWRVGADAKAK
jgi:hypothetical protein